MFEKLELRQLLSNALHAGVLTVTGTGASENITIAQSGSKVTVNQTGQPGTVYQAASILHIVVNANGGNDKVDCSTVNVPVELHGGSGNDTLVGGNGGDNLFGEDGNDTIYGGAGKDALHGGAGNDDLDGGAGNDFLDGGAGSDTADYSTRTSKITAEIDVQGTAPTATKNTFTEIGSGGQSGEKDTYSGIETLSGGSNGDDLTFNGPAIINSNLPSPNFGNYAILGNGGNDVLSADGASFIDDAHILVTLSGGSGNDSMSSDPATINAFEFGGSGNDTFGASEEEGVNLPGPRVVDAGSGTDLEVIATHDVPAVTLGTNLENLKIEGQVRKGFTVTGNSLNNNIDASGQASNGGVTVNGEGGNDTITGSTFADNLNGGSGDDLIHGGNGNDTLTGGTGHDMLFGDAGNDTLFGKDSAKDSLNGGTGTDKAQRDAGLDVLTSIETII